MSNGASLPGAVAGALALAPSDPASLNDVAMLLLRQGRHVDALRVLVRALAVRSDLAGIHVNCGGILYELAEWQQAIDCYDRALARDPGRADAHANRLSALQFLGSFADPRPGHRRALALLNEVDVALDPFPFNGCTMTFEALWMGVPVVALEGSRFLSRMSAGFLRHAGLDELVAADRRAYVDLAASLAGDAARREALRRTLRTRLTQSPLCDAEAHARSLVGAYRRLWRRWCTAPAVVPGPAPV